MQYALGPNSTGAETAALQWKIKSLPDTNPTL